MFLNHRIIKFFKRVEDKMSLNILGEWENPNNRRKYEVKIIGPIGSTTKSDGTILGYGPDILASLKAHGLSDVPNVKITNPKAMAAIIAANNISNLSKLGIEMDKPTHQLLLEELQTKGFATESLILGENQIIK